jgi:hypothetical protein
MTPEPTTPYADRFVPTQPVIYAFNALVFAATVLLYAQASATHGAQAEAETGGPIASAADVAEAAPAPGAPAGR